MSSHDEPAEEAAVSAWPYVSVIMPARNEEAFIDRSLGAVLAQDYPPDRFEVLVADGMSTDGTRARVQALAGGPVSVRLLDNPGRITPMAMNIGIRAASGSVIVRVDGHAVIPPEYVRRAVLALWRTGAHNVGGAVRSVSTGVVASAIAAALSSRFGVGGSAWHYAETERETDTVPFGVYPAWVLDRIGLYDEELVRNQDDELNDRLLKAGGRIVLCPELRSDYYPRATLQKLARQYHQYGLWKVRVLQKHPRQLRKSHFVPGAFVAALILGIIGAPLWGVARLLLGLVLLLWGAGALAASLAAARRWGWRVVPLMPIAFLVVHVSYGLGFLAGLIRFAGRWGDAGAPVAPLPAGRPGLQRDERPTPPGVVHG